MFCYMLLESFFPQPFNFGNQICKTYGSKLCKYLGKIIIQELTKQHEASAKRAEMEAYNQQMRSQNIECEAREEEAGEFIECAEVYAGGAVGETGEDSSEAGG